ncbi:hypothetical protein EDB87DRAFT_1647417 [Lactarius vividus]|nr:hypothetical protein EDB87DRAFT_1647417 [Lactarius vividus]
MRVCVRWFFIRNFHKFNVNDISLEAFVTYFLGHGLWIHSERHSFSVVFAVVNSFRL